MAGTLGLDRRKRRTGLLMLLLAAAMVTLGFASVPLYRMFCQVTGFNGTTQKNVGGARNLHRYVFPCRCAAEAVARELRDRARTNIGCGCASRVNSEVSGRPRARTACRRTGAGRLAAAS